MTPVDYFFSGALVACSVIGVVIFAVVTEERQRYVIAVVCAAGLLLTGAWMTCSNREWEKYKEENGCRPTDETRDATVQGGRAVVQVKEHRWVCDDGREFWGAVPRTETGSH